MNLNTRKKNGFTMIELIAVIVILGILAAAAVPRFMDARRDAEEGVARGIEAAWRSECSMAVSRAMLSGDDFACPTYSDGGQNNSFDVELAGATFDVTATAGNDDTCTLTFTGGRLGDDFSGALTFDVPESVLSENTGGGN
ncbi:hypothetical protein JCM16814_24250 [Desulfobaculum senezii]